MNTPNHPCEDRLRALTAANFDHWQSLGPDCTYAAAEAAFGPTDAVPLNSDTLGNQWMLFRRYPAQGIAPYGITVWLANETEIYAVQINEPTLTEGVWATLGDPDFQFESGLGVRYQQWLYVSQGLVFHRHTFTHQVLRLYMFMPMSYEDYLKTGIASVKAQRRPRN